MISHSPLRRRIAAIAAAGALSLSLAACSMPGAGIPASSSAPQEAPLSGASPVPGRTVEATPPAGDPTLRGVRLALVVADSENASGIMQDAVHAFAQENGLVVEQFVGAGDEASIAAAFAAALATQPHIVVGLGRGAVDVFAYQTPQFLDQDFLLLGAQVAEPTANLASVVWDGATSRGSGAPADGELDDATVTSARVTEAISVGVATVMAGTSGIVLHLPG